MDTRKLYRSQDDRMIGGVCGGLGKYLHLDTTLVRLVFILLFFLGLHGLLVYLIMWVIVPAEPQLVVDQSPPVRENPPPPPPAPEA
jgi:phage shock protein C